MKFDLLDAMKTLEDNFGKEVEIRVTVDCEEDYFVKFRVWLSDSCYHGVFYVSKDGTTDSRTVLKTEIDRLKRIITKLRSKKRDLL